MAVTLPTIGELRQSGTLQINNKIALGAGYEDEFIEVAGMAGTRGRLRKSHGSRILDNGETILSSNWEWICRFQVNIENVINKKAMRWLIENRFFVIASYEQLEGKRFYYRFILQEDE